MDTTPHHPCYIRPPTSPNSHDSLLMGHHITPDMNMTWVFTIVFVNKAMNYNVSVTVPITLSCITPTINITSKLHVSLVPTRVTVHITLFCIIMIVNIASIPYTWCQLPKLCTIYSQ